MKKVGIITFHHALSYGAILQSYALQNYLLINGIDNEIVDYQCETMYNKYQKLFRKISNNKIKNIALCLLTAKGIIKERKTSKLFINKYIKTSKSYSSISICTCQDKYKYFISGSDQVWSPTCVGFDPVYFLTFAKPEQKYTYAASIATNTIPENLKEEFTKRISDFSGYSMREKSGANIVKELTGKDSIINIDPTLLLDKTEWDKIASSELQEPYIFLFTVLKPKNLIKYALKLAEEKNMKVIYLNKMHTIKHKNLQYIDPVTADKFVGLIKNASYVCTNSFHGNAFSIIYHKNFIVETDNSSNKKNIRSQELMQMLGLEDRIYSSSNTPNIECSTDWEKVDKIIKSQQQKSYEYLSNIDNKFSQEEN